MDKWNGHKNDYSCFAASLLRSNQIARVKNFVKISSTYPSRWLEEKQRQSKKKKKMKSFRITIKGEKYLLRQRGTRHVWCYGRVGGGGLRNPARKKNPVDGWCRKCCDSICESCVRNAPRTAPIFVTNDVPTKTIWRWCSLPRSPPFFAPFFFHFLFHPFRINNPEQGLAFLQP